VSDEESIRETWKSDVWQSNFHHRFMELSWISTIVAAEQTRDIRWPLAQPLISPGTLQSRLLLWRSAIVSQAPYLAPSWIITRPPVPPSSSPLPAGGKIMSTFFGVQKIKDVEVAIPFFYNYSIIIISPIFFQILARGTGHPWFDNHPQFV